MTRRFEGWYFKQQAHGCTLALIPGRGKEGAFIQVVTDQRAWYVEYPVSSYRRHDLVSIAGNDFTRKGVRLDIHRTDLTLTGELHYQDLTPLTSDIMGPFRFLPMQCRHQVISMDHTVSGRLTLNGEILDFSGGRGYIEGDSGRSFPKSYTWVQCNCFEDQTSVMASIAHIPFAGLCFTGCIAVVWYGSREYRLATYYGVRILKNTASRIELRQGALRLVIDLPPQRGHDLRAPNRGVMHRIIKEAPACTVRFRFWEENQLLFDKTSEYAGFEHVSNMDEVDESVHSYL